jgi:hypothetical protein
LGGSYIDTCGSTSGISQYDIPNESIDIFPNPVNDIQFISGLKNPSMVSVYDISGKLLLKRKDVTKEIDISCLAKGMYFIKVIMQEGSVVRKFIKE